MHIPSPQIEAQKAGLTHSLDMQQRRLQEVFRFHLYRPLRLLLIAFRLCGFVIRSLTQESAIQQQKMQAMQDKLVAQVQDLSRQVLFFSLLAVAPLSSNDSAPWVVSVCLSVCSWKRRSRW